VAGQALQVTIQVTPASGTQTYALEDVPPSGWAVSGIDNSGSWDGINGKVKWGPYFDNQARTLHYSVTPPAGTTGAFSFTGVVSIDGVNSAVCGTSSIDVCSNLHPADTSTNWRVEIGEVTAYGSCWKTGCTWSSPPTNIPIEYVTNAGLIWKTGEVYHYDSSKTPPSCWVPGASSSVVTSNGALGRRLVWSGVQPLGSALTISSFNASSYRPGVGVAVIIAVTPETSTQVYTVEEIVPIGWTVSGIDNGGQFDRANGKVKWGPFFENESRKLGYTVTPPTGERGSKTFVGVVSFDGTNVPVGGTRSISSSRVTARTVVDFNADRYADGFLYDGVTGVWSEVLGNGGQGFSTLTNGSWSAGWTIKTADFNGDGITDLFLYNADSGRWFKAISDGLGGFTYFEGQWSPGWEVHIVELNGDGRSDVFIYNSASGSWRRCTSVGDGTADFTYVDGTWDPGWSIYPVDWNGDGLTDLFLYNRSTGKWVHVTNDARDGWTYDVTGDWGPGWEICSGDFNGDGNTDLFLYNRVTGQWFVETSVGNDFTYVSGYWSPGWEVQVGDFDGDGRSDVFLYNVETGRWMECVSDGAGGFVYYGRYWDLGWQVYLTDLNGDGRSDVLLYNTATGRWCACLNTAPGSFTCAYGQWDQALTVVAQIESVP
jgi:hypothetical protein